MHDTRLYLSHTSSKGSCVSTFRKRRRAFPLSFRRLSLFNYLFRVLLSFNLNSVCHGVRNKSEEFYKNHFTLLKLLKRNRRKRCGSFGKMKPRSYVEKDRMLRASVRCQFKCIRCEGVRGRSAAGPPSLSSTLLRYYTASIVHIFYIYIHIIFYIYISTYTWTYHCLYEAEGTEAKRTEKKKNIYIYTYRLTV